MRKKILCAILCLALVCIFATQAMAAGATLTLSNSAPYRGNTVTATVKLSGVGQCTAGSLVVSYGSGLEWTGVTSKINGVNVDYKINEGRVVFYSMSGANMDGDLMTLTFKVKDGAALGDNTVKVTLSVNGQSITASAIVKVSCQHTFNNWAYWSVNTHTRTCSKCGEREVVNHIFDNSCDTTCDGCGTTREVTHQYGEEWVSDKENHWHECTICGNKTDVTPHNPGEEAGEYTDQLCTDCGAVVTPALGHTHRYDEKTFLRDENGHWKECTGCGEATETEPHVYNGDCDEVCDVCTYQREVTHQESEWEHDATGHWKVCTECGRELERYEHNWDAGYVQERPTTEKDGLAIFRCVDCMEEKQEVLPMEVIPEPPVQEPEFIFGDYFEWWGWLCVGAGGGVIVASIIWVIGCAIAAHKRKKLYEEVEV